MPLVEFVLENGAKVVMDVDPPAADWIVRVSRGGDGLLQAAQSFEGRWPASNRWRASVFSTVKDLAPEEAVVELGFKLSAESGVILAKAAGEAHVKVELVWKN